MSQRQQVSAKVTSGDRADEEFVVNYDMPENIQDALGMYKEEVVFSHLCQSITIALQSFMRTHIKKDGATVDSIQAAVDKWEPGVKKQGKPISERIGDLLGKLSPEERKAILEELL